MITETRGSIVPVRPPSTRSYVHYPSTHCQGEFGASWPAFPARAGGLRSPHGSTRWDGTVGASIRSRSARGSGSRGGNACTLPGPQRWPPHGGPGHVGPDSVAAESGSWREPDHPTASRRFARNAGWTVLGFVVSLAM